MPKCKCELGIKFHPMSDIKWHSCLSTVDTSRVTPAGRPSSVPPLQGHFPAGTCIKHTWLLSHLVSVKQRWVQLEEHRLSSSFLKTQINYFCWALIKLLPLVFMQYLTVRWCISISAAFLSSGEDTFTSPTFFNWVASVPFFPRGKKEAKHILNLNL